MSRCSRVVVVPTQLLWIFLPSDTDRWRFFWFIHTMQRTSIMCSLHTLNTIVNNKVQVSMFLEVKRTARASLNHIDTNKMALLNFRGFILLVYVCIIIQMFLLQIKYTYLLLFTDTSEKNELFVTFLIFILPRHIFKYLEAILIGLHVIV
jgi:hypothetical protein